MLDSRSKKKPCTNYLDREQGVSYVRIFDSNKVVFSENDIVNNSFSDYSVAQKSKKRVEATIIALDLIIEQLINLKL